ncbi:MAG: ferrous iron transport protein A, partial [Anaerolineae bacterium]|nr:ferrous iron transport protein A [Anaerolineae bacterium]
MIQQNSQNMEETVVALNRLNPGQSGRIMRVSGQPAARRRLLELGLVRGEMI